MKKLVFPFLAAVLLLLGAGSALVGCKNSTTTINQAALDRQNKYRAIDDSLIMAYLARHSYGPGSYTRTTAGLYLVTLASGPQEKPLAAPGKLVAVRYEGSFVNKERENSIFDSSYNGRTLCNCHSFLVDDPNQNTRAVTGFNDGLKLMREGDHKILLIPSYLAYGANGSGSIPPDTPLLFDLDVVSVSQ